MANSKWDINISNIREYKYRSAEFWNYMKEIANCIKKDGAIYRDLHRNEPNQQRELDDLIFVCIRLGEDGDVRQPEYYDCPHPTAWVLPGHISKYSCKNPLFVVKDKLYLSTGSTGFDLNASNMHMLLEGKLVVQEGKLFGEDTVMKELNMAIPVNQFVKLFFPSDDIVDEEVSDVESDLEIFI